jgi:hypothetical protein
MPVIHNSVFLALGIIILYYLNTRKLSIPLTYFTHHYIVTILISTFLVCFAFYGYTVLHEKYFDSFVKRMIIQFQMLFTLVLAYPILIEDRDSESFDIASQLICYVYAIQGVIHLTGFLVPAVGDWLISIKPTGLQDMLMGGENFRGFALTGSLFFELPAGYGIAFILFVRLQLISGQQYITGFGRYFVFCFIIIGIMLSGRTGFVGMAIGIVLYFIFVPDPFLIVTNLLKKAIAFVPAILIIYFFLLTPSQRQSFEMKVFPFAFEAFYNVQEGKEFGTASTDVTMSFYFPLDDKTLVFGAGADVYGGNIPFPATDAGYMRSVIYGGLPLLIILLIYQFLYFYVPLRLSSKFKTKEDRVAFWCFLLSFFYVLVLHIKDTALGTMHSVEAILLFMGSTYIIQYYNRPETEAIPEETEIQ